MNALLTEMNKSVQSIDSKIDSFTNRLDCINESIDNNTSRLDMWKDATQKKLLKTERVLEVTRVKTPWLDPSRKT